MGAGSPSPFHAVSGALGGVVAGIQTPVLRVVQATLLEPLVLGPAVETAWRSMRAVADGLLVVTLLYSTIRGQFMAILGLEAEPPWFLVPRVALAALGVATSLDLVRGLLALNNAFCKQVLALIPPVPGGPLRVLEAGALVTGVPALLGLGPVVTALAVLVGTALLACFYLIRSAEVVLLTLVLPLVAALWAAPPAAGLYAAVFAELCVSIFVQALQVLGLLAFATGLAGGAQGGGGWLWSVAALALLLRCRPLLGGLVGVLSRWPLDPGGLLGRLVPGMWRGRGGPVQG